MIVGIVFVTVCIAVLFMLNRQVYEHLVVVTSHYKENLNWLRESGLQLVVCSKVHDSPECPLHANRGREASAYLQYILSNYDHLPDHIAFVHGHEDAWHHGFDKPLLDVIRSAKFREYGFVSLNNWYIDDRTMDNDKMVYIRSIWNEVFRPFLKRDAPVYIYHDCCAQFIVSRERVLANSLEAYETWYELIMRDEAFDDGGYTWGIIFEMLWPLIFGEPDVVDKKAYLRRFK